ncbi:MAG: hypothetical protein H0T85_07730 [Geodermatophilaceae bacterium]|nr:hypothetical protein [Geodermatophilaceae bacterium]
MTSRGVDASAPGAPPSVRLAALLLFVVGGLLLLTGGGVAVVRQSIAEQAYPAATEATLREGLSGDLLVVGVVFVVLAVLCVLVGLGLRRRRRWARPGGIALGVILGVAGVQFLLGNSGNLLALVLPVGAMGVAVTVVAGLLNRDAVAWFTGRRGEALGGTGTGGAS